VAASIEAGGRQSAPFTIRAKVKSRTAEEPAFSGLFCKELPLFTRGGTDI